MSGLLLPLLDGGIPSVLCAQVPGAPIPASVNVLPTPIADPEGSLAHLRPLLAEDPDRIEWRIAAAREATVLGILDETRDVRLAHLEAARADAAAAVALDSTSVDAHYWLAVAQGLSSDQEGGRAKIAFARQAHGSASRVLDLDPTHGGGHHIMGRLQSGARRLSFLSRMIGRALGLSEIIDSASWESAEHHMRMAVEQDPGQWVHHFELGRLLVRTGREEEGWAILNELANRKPRHRLDLHYAARAHADVEAGVIP